MSWKRSGSVQHHDVVAVLCNNCQKCDMDVSGIKNDVICVDRLMMYTNVSVAFVAEPYLSVSHNGENIGMLLPVDALEALDEPLEDSLDIAG